MTDKDQGTKGRIWLGRPGQGSQEKVPFKLGLQVPGTQQMLSMGIKDKAYLGNRLLLTSHMAETWEPGQSGQPGLQSSSGIRQKNLALQSDSMHGS